MTYSRVEDRKEGDEEGRRTMHFKLCMMPWYAEGATNPDF